jgi:hypothetical protein
MLLIYSNNLSWEWRILLLTLIIPGHKEFEYFGTTFERYKGMVVEELGSPAFSVYVASFCRRGDLLGQWRAYGADHGYAIEFKTAALDAAAMSLPGYPRAKMLAPVHYGAEAASAVVLEALRAVSEDSNLGHPGVHAHYMALQLSTLRATVKHPGFSEEEEWRASAGFERHDRDVARFRSSSMAIIPYIEVPFAGEAITSIRVGPGRHVDIRLQGIERLLDSFDYKAKVISSQIPLRS